MNIRDFPVANLAQNSWLDFMQPRLQRTLQQQNILSYRQRRKKMEKKRKREKEKEKKKKRKRERGNQKD